MNWFLHNSIADLYGPYFLLFYAGTIVTLVVACYRSVRGVDRTIELELPKITSKVDPYEVAYLRGGENEVARVAIASLIQRGLLQITAGKRLQATTKQIDRRRAPLSGELTPIEARVMKWEGFPALSAPGVSGRRDPYADHGALRPLQGASRGGESTGSRRDEAAGSVAVVFRHHRDCWSRRLQVDGRSCQRSPQRRIPGAFRGAGLIAQAIVCFAQPAPAVWARPISSN